MNNNAKESLAKYNNSNTIIPEKMATQRLYPIEPSTLTPHIEISVKRIEPILTYTINTDIEDELN